MSHQRLLLFRLVSRKSHPQAGSPHFLTLLSSFETSRSAAERCLTFLNERPKDFPEWLSPSWHNSLVGCMVCQKVCPANKNVLKWTESGATFEHEETTLILDDVPDDRLPRETLAKLKKLDMMEYYAVLKRNLRALIDQQQQDQKISKRIFFKGF